MLEAVNLVLQHKATGQAWDIAQLCGKIQWETHLRGQPGKLTFDPIASFNSADIEVSSGDIIYMEVNRKRIFWGFIFTMTQNRYGEKTFTAYDQVRYLSKTRMSDIFNTMTTDQIVRRAASKFSLNVGTLAKGSFTHDNWIQEDANILDIIDNSCCITFKHSQQILVFYDNSGALTLSTPENVFPDYQNYVIGNGSLATDFAYKQDIDANTFNSIVIERPNPTDGKTVSVGGGSYTYLPAQDDAAAIKQFGLLQKVLQVQQNMTDADMQQQAAAYLGAMKYPLETMNYTTLGVVGVRAGCVLPIYCPDLNLDFKKLLMDTVVHEWTDNDHQMTLDMRVML